MLPLLLLANVIEHFLCSGHCANDIIWIISFTPLPHSMNLVQFYYYLFFFFDRETKAQTDLNTCCKSCNFQVVNQGLEPM